MNGRTIFGWWFLLIALYTVVSNSDGVASALGIVGDQVRRIGDPNVPLIRDHTPTTGTNYINVVPGASNGGGGGGVSSW